MTLYQNSMFNIPAVRRPEPHRCLILANLAAGTVKAWDRTARFSRRLSAMFDDERPLVPGGPAVLNDIAEMAAEAGLEVNVEAMPVPEDLPQLLRAAEREGYQTIVAAGGDRSVRTLAQFMVGSPLQLGMIPAGTANNIAHSLGIPQGARAAMQVISANHASVVDVGRVKNQFFLEAAGVGLFAEVIRQTCHTELRWHQLARMWKIMTPLLLNPPARNLRLILDGADYRKEAAMVTVANGAYIGEGFRISPGARMDDGKFDVVIVGAMNRSQLFRFAHALLNGRHLDLPYVDCVQAAAVEIHRVSAVGQPLPVHVDDSIAAYTPVKIDMAAGALKVLIPLPESYVRRTPA